VARWRLQLLHIDDPLDAFAVHGACGMWGIFSCALFSSKVYVTAYAPHHEHGGLFTDGGTKLLGAAALFALAHVRAAILVHQHAPSSLPRPPPPRTGVRARLPRVSAARVCRARLPCA
jgi:ammonia channel protein AmtB